MPPGSLLLPDFATTLPKSYLLSPLAGFSSSDWRIQDSSLAGCGPEAPEDSLGAGLCQPP